MVKVSVIIPVFNVEKYLRECLNNLLNQTLTDIEIICINDGSTDNSLNILKEYEKDSRVKIISQDNKGASACRNYGLNISCGEYIYFHDSDDYLKTDALKKLYDLACEGNLDLIIFKLINFDENGNMDYNYSDMPFLPEDIFTYRDIEKDLFKVDVTVYTKFFKRKLIEDKRFCEGLIFEDNAFYFDYIFDAQRIYFLDECLYYRRIRDNSVISSGFKNYKDIIEINDIIYGKFKEKKLYLKFKDPLLMRKIDSTYYRFTLLPPEFKEEYFTLMKNSFENHDDKNLNDYTGNIYNAVIRSDTPAEFELNLKLNNLKKEYDKLKKENRKLKKQKLELLSSASWKITEPLRKLRRK